MTALLDIMPSGGTKKKAGKKTKARRSSASTVANVRKTAVIKNAPSAAVRRSMSIGKRRIRRWKSAIRNEVANSITHGIGAGLSIAGLSVLVTLAAIKGDAWRVVSFSIYGSTLVMLYLSSTLYHGLSNLRAKHVFRIMDHSSIFLTIAGSYTPFTLVMMRGAWGWTLFGLVWGLAAFGILFKIFFVHRFDIASTIVYILMGWLIVIAYNPMKEVMPAGCIAWLLAGGISYTAGTAFYAWHSLPYHHAIWHLFVLTGSIMHFFAILFYVLPT